MLIFIEPAGFNGTAFAGTLFVRKRQRKSPKPKAHQQKQGVGGLAETEVSGVAAKFLLSPPPLIGSGPTGDPQPISGSGESRNQSQAERFE